MKPRKTPTKGPTAWKTSRRTTLNKIGTFLHTKATAPSGRVGYFAQQIDGTLKSPYVRGVMSIPLYKRGNLSKAETQSFIKKETLQIA